uniref:At1g61320/AtMIF1 LRR domain-containing protein n=1 Tax=Leersia perrieri TaxID=77586 RepID=A0A0D9WTD8_9ORYZ
MALESAAAGGEIEEGGSEEPAAETALQPVAGAIAGVGAEGGSGERAAEMALQPVDESTCGEEAEGGSEERSVEMALQPVVGSSGGEEAEGGGGGEHAAETALESDADASGSAVKRRRVEYGERKEIPDDVLQLIISYLPLRQVIALRVRPRAAPSVDGVVTDLGVTEVGGRADRLDCLAVVVHTMMKSSQMSDIIERAATRGVRNLHIEVHNITARDKVRFRFPILSRELERLYLSNVIISSMAFKDNRNFDEFAEIYFDSVSVSGYVFRKVMMRCPKIRILDLRRCTGLDAVDIPPGATNLISLTIVECDSLKRVDVSSVPRLHSVFYSGRFISSFYLPRARATFTNLYICYSGSILPQVFGEWSRNTLPNLSNLTICSNSLERLTELQLLMFQMKASNLADIYAFLKTFHFPNLAKLFLQLPRIRDQENTIHLQSVSEEMPEGRLDNLQVVRIMKFTGSQIEMQLVSFLLRKARFIRTLQLVSPSPNTIPLDALGSEGQDIQRALDNGVIKFGESDDDATRPCHSELFIKF